MLYLLKIDTFLRGSQNPI